MAYLYDKLKEYSKSGCYGFHMPGHKRNGGLIGAELPYSLDITEIDGFDDLHHSHGILKEAQERAARMRRISWLTGARQVFSAQCLDVLSPATRSLWRATAINRSIMPSVSTDSGRSIFIRRYFRERR